VEFALVAIGMSGSGIAGSRRSCGTTARSRRVPTTWAMDFVHDQLATGRKIRVLTVVDTFSPYAPAIDPRLSYRGENVVQVLEKVYARVGYPTTIRVDQGTEFVSRDLDLWAYTRGVTLIWTSRGQANRPKRVHRGL
jgi:putative transposase